MRILTSLLLTFVLAFLGPLSTDLAYAAGHAPPLAIRDEGYFFVGGHYTDPSTPEVMAGQMYVFYQIPQTHSRQHHYPIVMVHGAGQTGTNFLKTPDGREGWAEFFLHKGYPVYVIDQPGRGKSAYISSVYAPLTSFGASQLVSLFTAPEKNPMWPQASLHTQWPGAGVPGDPIFDQFFASQVPFISDALETDKLNQAALAALLDRIGPAIVLTHSQSGTFGWLVADARPHLVKAIIAVEPSGPPFFNSPVFGGAPSRAWGITNAPITYSPPVSDPSQIAKVQESAPDGPGLVACWMQQEPARQLPNLEGIPILILTSQASYHSQYDHCTSKYLTQAGVQNDFVRLPDVGIYGNGHMMMLEKNNLVIAAYINGWLTKTFAPSKRHHRHHHHH